MRTYSLLFLLILISIGYGCSSPNTGVSTLVTPSVETAPSKITEAQQPSKTPSQIPTKVIETLIPTISPTVIPTVVGNDPGEIAANLFLYNNGCLYPCWGGIVPGRTKWEDVKEYLSTFASEIKSFEIFPSIEEGSTSYLVEGPIPVALEPSGKFGALIDVDREGIVRFINYSADFSSIGRDISYFLATYGVPDEVLIWTSGRTLNSYQEGYRLLLNYPSQGILMEYYAELPMEETIDICPADLIGFLNIWLWNPEEQLSFDDLYEFVSFGGRKQDYKRLEKISELDTNEFFQLYENSNNLDVCFEVEVTNY